MDAKKCDRCGVFFIATPHNFLGRFKEDYDNTEYCTEDDFDDVDLCDDCMVEFNKWLKNECVQ